MMPQEVTTLLIELEKKHGATIIREGAKKYLLRRTYAGELPTKRKPIPKAWIEKAWWNQHHLCSRCKFEIETLAEAVGDHYKPLARGGKHSQGNIRALHSSCNSSKGANNPIQESKLTGQTYAEQIRGME